MWFSLVLSVYWLDKDLGVCFLEGCKHLRANCTFGWEKFDFDRDRRRVQEGHVVNGLILMEEI